MLEHDLSPVERLGFRDRKREIDSIVVPRNGLTFSKRKGLLAECEPQLDSEGVSRFRSCQPDDNVLGVGLAMDVGMGPREWVENEVGDVYGRDVRFFAVIICPGVRRASSR